MTKPDLFSLYHEYLKPLLSKCCSPPCHPFSVRLQGIYYGAFFQDNQSVIDWVNSQRLTTPLICLGDGHDGVWKLFQEIGISNQREEILDWYHLEYSKEKMIQRLS